MFVIDIFVIGAILLAASIKSVAVFIEWLFWKIASKEEERQDE